MNMFMKKYGVTIIIVAIVALIGGGVLLANTLYKEKATIEEENVPKQNETKDPVDDNDTLAQNLNKKIDEFILHGFDYFGKDVKISNNVTNEQLYIMTMFYWYQNNQSDITKAEVDSYMKNAYGITLKSYPNIKCVVEGNDLLKYNKETENYEVVNLDTLHGHGGVSMSPMHSKVDSYLKEDDMFTVTLVKVFKGGYMFGGNEEYYSDHVYKNKIEELQQFYVWDSENEDTSIKYFNENYKTFTSKLTKYEYKFQEVDGEYILKEYKIIN